MVRFLLEIGQHDLAQKVVDVAVRWAVCLGADLRLPDPALADIDTDTPVALRLLVDRLDCPSRMVQERAARTLAALLADPDTHDSVANGLVLWHGTKPLEMRSCLFLIVLLLARTAYNVDSTSCESIANRASLNPTPGCDLLLHELSGAATAPTARPRYDVGVTPGFQSIPDFESTVRGHLAPVFLSWALDLEQSGIPFSRQWQWEADRLAQAQGLSLALNAHFQYHYRGGARDRSLAINDRLSVVLRSSFLRALHWAIDEAGANG